jgi:hypothetical protein
MTITEHFFGLIQCYSEVGDCRIGDFSFNIMLIIPLYILVITIIIGCLYALWFPYYKKAILSTEFESYGNERKYGEAIIREQEDEFSSSRGAIALFSFIGTVFLILNSIIYVNTNLLEEGMNYAILYLVMKYGAPFMMFCIFIASVIGLIKQYWWDTPAEPEQLLDSIVSQGEPQ